MLELKFLCWERCDHLPLVFPYLIVVNALTVMLVVICWL